MKTNELMCKIPYTNNTVQLTTTKGDLIRALAEFDDDDDIVIEMDDNFESEELHLFYVDVARGIQLEDGSERNEIRLCPVKHKDIIK